MSPPAYLLLPRAGFPPEKLDAELRRCGLVRTAEEPRRGGQPRRLRWSDAADAACSEVEYREDHTLGQGLIYLFGPRAQELAGVCLQSGPCLSPPQALARAQAAGDPVSKIETLSPWAALLGGGAVTVAEARAVLSSRLRDAEPSVRRAALLVCLSVAGARGAELRAALQTDAQLAPVVRRALSAHAQADGAELAAEVVAGEAAPASAKPQPAPAQRSADSTQGERQESLPSLSQIQAALAQDPLASAAYWARARHGAAAGELWPALFDVTTALAVARRQGVYLKEMLELQTTLRQKLAQAPEPPPAAVELQAVRQLALLLHLGRFHEVEEIAELLLTLPGRPPLWWLAVGLSRRERGRSVPAVTALDAALETAPGFQAARFIRGQCQQDLGNLEGARQDFARLDPQPDVRPPRPTLLDAYADELLGVQAPWESAEHAFARVQLLRQLDCPDEALAVTSRLIAREPPAADALLAHGILLGELARPAESLAALDRGLMALSPEERLCTEPDPLAILQLHRAYALCALDRRDEASAALRIALRSSPERATAVAAELFPTSPSAPPPAAGYAVLRRLAQQDLLSSDSADDAADQAPPAATTAQPEHAGATALPAPAALGNTPEDVEVAVAAVRMQVAELLTAALAVLDDEKGADAARELLLRARRGLVALWPLLPPQVAARAASVPALLSTVATALGLPQDEADRLAAW